MKLKLILLSILALPLVGIGYFWLQPQLSLTAATVARTAQGGTGTSSPSGILYGDGSTALKTVAIGPNLTFAAGTLSASGGGGGGGSGSIGTSSPGVIGSLLYYTTSWATPELVAPVATGTLTASAPLSINATRYLVGGPAAVSLDTSGTWAGNASTATALFANGSNCSAGSAAGGVSAAGVAEDCTDYEEALTAGDALTRTGNDFDFDGGATPAGDLGNTWASPSVDDDSHAHTGATISGLDISDDTNLTAGDHLTLTGDDLDVDDDFILNTGDIGTGHYVLPSLLSTISSTTNATTSSLYVTALTSALALFDSNSKATEYAGIDCTNQFVRDVSAAGAGTCASVSLTADISGVLGIGNGGTGTGTPAVWGDLLYWNGTNWQGRATSTLGISAAAGGSNTQVQFNDSTALAGDSSFTWNKTTNVLTIDTITIADGDISETGNLGISAGGSGDLSLNATGDSISLTSGTFAVSAGTQDFLSNQGLYRFAEENLSLAAILDSTAIASSDKTFTFPNLSGTFALTGAAQTLDFSGGTVTFASIVGAIDAGAATSLEIPNGTGPTVDAIGEIAIDTTANELLYATSTAAGAPAVIKPFMTVSFNYGSTTQGTGTTTKYLAPTMGAGYLDSVRCDFSNFMRVVFHDGTNRTNDLTASSTIGMVKFTTNQSFTDGEPIRVDIGTTTNLGTNVQGGCRAKYIYTRN